MKVIYHVHLPIEREGMPAGARLEIEDAYIPGLDVAVFFLGYVSLFVQFVKYDPIKKIAHVDLSFFSDEDAYYGDEGEIDSSQIDASEIARYETQFEDLVRSGWLPLNREDLEESVGNESVVQKTVVH